MALWPFLTICGLIFYTIILAALCCQANKIKAEGDILKELALLEL